MRLCVDYIAFVEMQNSLGHDAYDEISLTIKS